MARITWGCLSAEQIKAEKSATGLGGKKNLGDTLIKVETTKSLAAFWIAAIPVVSREQGEGSSIIFPPDKLAFCHPSLLFWFVGPWPWTQS